MYKKILVCLFTISLYLKLQTNKGGLVCFSVNRKQKKNKTLFLLLYRISKF